MRHRRLSFNPAVSFMQETLESRVVMSAAVLNSAVADIAARAARVTATTSTLQASAGTLGQPINFAATVRASASAGAPTGTVNLLYRGQVIQTATLTPIESGNGRFAESRALFSLTPQPGGPAYFFGRHAFTVQYVPGGAFARSSASALVNVARPAYHDLGNGVKVAVIQDGTGTPAQSGQTASILYTGYLAKTGAIFDDSSQHGNVPLTFTLGQGQVIPGFDAGVQGMRVGETRIILIPAVQGYGRMSVGSIPANSSLVFVAQLQAKS